MIKGVSLRQLKDRVMSISIDLRCRRDLEQESLLV